jgi:ABC-type transport system involved in multi-copper enzyme maturation permease subunit
MTNPLLWLELRVRIRERKLWIISLLYLICLLGMSAIPLANVYQTTIFAPVPPADVGILMLCVSGSTLLALLLLLSPMSSAPAISQEREQRTLVGLLNTPLSPSRIAWGKLMGTWIFVLWLLALSCPFMFLSTVWCGISVWYVLAGIGIIFAAAAMISTVALGLSGFFKRTITSYLGTGMVAFLWFIVWPILGAMCENLLVPHDNSDLQLQYERIIYVVFFSHHPAAPLLVLYNSAIGIQESLPLSTGTAVGMALGIWLVVGLLFFALACRGIRRGLSEK